MLNQYVYLYFYLFHLYIFNTAHIAGLFLSVSIHDTKSTLIISISSIVLWIFLHQDEIML